MYQTFLVTEKLKFFYLNNLRPYKENSIRLLKLFAFMQKVF